MKKLPLIFFVVPFFAIAQNDLVLSGVYKWSEPVASKQNKISSVVLFSGKIHDFENLEVTANSLKPSPERIQRRVPKNEEHLIIVKSGRLQIGFPDSNFSLEAGSVAVVMPRESILLNCTQSCSFYLLKYRRKSSVIVEKTKGRRGSFVKFWNAIPFQPNNNGGGRKDYFNRATALSKRFEMHVTFLKEGAKSHDPHTHQAEEIILVIEGDTEMQIGQDFYKGKTGDLYFVRSNVLHGIRNEGTAQCRYFAFQFE